MAEMTAKRETRGAQIQREEFKELLDEYAYERPGSGQILEGEIMEIDNDAVIVDLGAKHDVVIPRQELDRIDQDELQNISVGDTVPVYVTGFPGRNQEELRGSIERGLEWNDWNRAEEHLQDESILELDVTGHNKGGLLVAFGRLEGFVPNSHIPDLHRWRSRDALLAAKADRQGSKLHVKVIEVDRDVRRLVLSAKAAQGERRRKRLQDLSVGEQITGKVTNIVKFGAFVDLGGIDGLIHISKLAWDHIKHPSEVLSKGDTVEVLVDSVDAERGRVGLNRKVLLPSPWDEFSRQYPEGSILEGRINGVKDFGAFVGLTDSITGLVHVSEFSDGPGAAPLEALSVGETVLVRIIGVDVHRHRVSLSMRGISEQDGILLQSPSDSEELTSVPAQDATAGSPEEMGDSLSQSPGDPEDLAHSAHAPADSPEDTEEGVWQSSNDPRDPAPVR